VGGSIQKLMEFVLTAQLSFGIGGKHGDKQTHTNTVNVNMYLM